ncbi:response regulator [Longispora albida]|uniref:response regulator n=1 Tax=Longispora albida TaxID=203523 RepID=UPI0003653207|nr:response regulator transcription factor [Longispora albida]
MTEPVRVLIADDQRLIRESLAALLGLEDGVVVAGLAADGQEAVERALELRPDVVLMDVRMPVLDGVSATAQLRARVPGCQVLMLSTFDDEEHVVHAVRTGAAGYLLKDLPAAELARAVRLAHAGTGSFGPAATARLAEALGRLGPAAATGPVPDLTGRELDVLRQLAAGASNREIAAALYVSEGTVKNHVSRIIARLGVRDRTQAAIYARDHGLG